ncbi:uncharacterized protein LOC119609419 [Lucilia sericata]|uniref:uncharacterized protein LOC119609419 n=1 Tax=Lucilia sericata TaxID=13632 RepID=UPI0018A7FAF0|nr:uncharacterized protein LOC119609419 [Lucilia sericata]
MTNHRMSNSEEHPSAAKRKRVLAAVAQDIVTSDDDDHVADGTDICNIMENHIQHQRQSTTTSSALHALGETIRNTLLEINEIREQNRERRHKELLQVLTKMTQQGSPTKISSNPDLLDKEHNTVPIAMDRSNENNSTTTDLNQLLIAQRPLDKVMPVEKAPTKYIKLLPKPQATNLNTQSLSKTDVIPLKKDSTKEELQNMRAKMLELQRKKMEDRERKKREFLQMQNI